MNALIIIVIIGAIVFCICRSLKYATKESVIVGKILEVVNDENFNEEQFCELKKLLSAINRMPSVLQYDISGDYTVLSNITQQILPAAKSEAKDIINTIIIQYNSQADKK